MTDPMSPEELRACRERAEGPCARPGFISRTCERGTNGCGVRHNVADVPRLLATIAARDARLEAVGAVLSENGCDCDRDHHEEECDDECDHGDPCLACRIEAAMKGAGQ